MYKEKLNNQISKMITNILFLVIPATGYYVYHSKLFLWFLLISATYSILHLLFLTVWIKKNKPNV